MNPYESTSEIFEAVRAPARLKILLAIGRGEACVCHLEARLGMRQAYISQQLMVLREKKLISARREGKYVYYRLKEPELIEMILLAARLAGVPQEDLDLSGISQCACPKCVPAGPVVVEIDGERYG